MSISREMRIFLCVIVAVMLAVSAIYQPIYAEAENAGESGSGGAYEESFREQQILGENDDIKAAIDLGQPDYNEAETGDGIPTAPGNLSLVSKTETAVSLAWEAAGDDIGVTGYDVYNGTSLVGSTEGELNATVEGLEPNTVCSFTVKARDAEGNISPASNILTVKTLSNQTGLYVLQVDGGDNYSAAVRNDGTVWAWGANGSGQLGDGTTEGKSMPVQVSLLNGVQEIWAGTSHTLALKNDGTVWSWGRNSGGQLGDGTRIYRSAPVQVSEFSGVVTAAAGFAHSLAVKSDGTVWAWGSNVYGQLGDGSNVSKYTPVQVQGLSGVVAVAAGYGHSLAVKSDGTVWTWGMNTFGQLGDGTTANKNIPGQVYGMDGATAVTGGYGFSAVLKADGTVWSFGDYALLDGANNNTPVQMPGLSGIKAISSGDYHLLALNNAGTVFTWGIDCYGQPEGVTDPIECIPPVQITELAGMISVAAGMEHSMALGADGKVYSWGENNYGELGDYTLTQRNTPVEAPALPFAPADLEQPTAPTDLMLVSKTNTSVEMSWTASTDNTAVMGYKIYRNGIEAGKSTGTSYIDTGLMERTEYEYKVKAYDAGGNISDESNALNVVTDYDADTEAPTAPGNLSLVAKTETAVSLAWEMSGDNVGVAGYDIYNGTSLVGSTEGELNYTAEGLEPNTVCSFTVKARDEEGNISPASNAVNVITTPSIPVNLHGTASSHSLTISWTPVEGIAEYDIEADGVIIDNGSSTAYVHSGLTPNTEHTYRVRARNVDGAGEWSSIMEEYTTYPSYTVNCAVGRVFDFVVSGSNIKSFTGKKVTITYNPGELEIVDLNGATPRIDMDTGSIPDTDVVITSFTPGAIEFVVNTSVASGRVWSGVTNIIRFKAKINGASNIIYNHMEETL